MGEGEGSAGAGRPRRAGLLAFIPSEVATMLGFAIAILGVVATGSAIAAAIPEPSPWIFAAAYGGPAALAFGVYWALARRL